MIKRSNSVKGKHKTRFLAGAALLAVSMLFVSCPREVGLGGAVDTQKPVVSIMSPDVDAVIKDVITLTGKATDETALDSVTVCFQSTEANYSKSYTANLDKASGTWSLTVDTKDATNGLIDYKYEVIVTARDKSGKTSTAARSFQIDNSFPTILVTKPSTFGYSETVAFYKQVEIKGETYDASSVKYVKVGLYTEDGTLVTEKTADGTETWSAVFYEDDFKNSAGQFKTGVLSSIANNQKKPLYIYVRSEDRAGNISEYYYHKSDVYSILSLKKSAGDELYFPTTAQIGQLDANRSALSVSGVSSSGQSISYPVSKTELNGKKHEAFSAVNANPGYPHLYFTNEATATIEWNNLNLVNPSTGSYDANYFPSISQNSEILASIQPVSDGSSVNLDTLKIWFIKEGADPVELSYAKTDPNVHDFEATKLGEAVNLTINISNINTGTYDVYLYAETNSGTKVGYSPDSISSSIKNSNDYDGNGNNGGYINKLSIVSVLTTIDPDSFYPQNLDGQHVIFPESSSADVWYVKDDFKIPVTITSLNEGTTISMTVGSITDVAPTPGHNPATGSGWRNVRYTEENSKFEADYVVDVDAIKPGSTPEQYNLAAGKQVRVTIKASVGGGSSVDDKSLSFMIQRDVAGPTLTVDTPAAGIRYTSTADDDAMTGTTLHISGTVFESTGAGLKSIDNVSSVNRNEAVYYQIRSRNADGTWPDWGTSWTNCPVATNDSDWSADVTIASSSQGEKAIRIKAIDNLGNESHYPVADADFANGISFYYDNTAPTITFADGKDIPEYYNRGSITDAQPSRTVSIKATVADDWAIDTIEVKLDGTVLTGANAFSVVPVDAKSSTIEKDYTIGGSTPGLSEGSHTFVFTIKDKSGRQTVVTKTVTVDTVLPKIAIPAYHVNGDRNEAPLTTTNWVNQLENVSFSAIADESGSGIDVVKYTFDYPVPAENSSAWQAVGNPANTNVIIENFTSDGAKKISLQVFDKAGNKSAVRTYDFSVDTQAPVLTVTGDAPTAATGATILYVSSESTYYTNGGVELTGTATDANGLADTDPFVVTFGSDTLDTGVSIPSGTLGSWTIVIPKNKISDVLAQTLSITAKDKSGTTTRRTFLIRLDETAPTLRKPESLSDADTSITEYDDRVLSFSVVDNGIGLNLGSAAESQGIKYKVNGGAYTYPTTANFDITLDEGAGQTIIIEGKDKLGNSFTKTYTNINVDFNHPVLSDITTAPQFVKYGESYTFGGSATDNIALDKVRVTATLNNQRVDSTGATTSGYWFEKSFTGTVTSANAAALAIPDFTTAGKTSAINGSWKFTIEVLDKSGNVSNSVSREFTVDISKPVIEEVTQYPGKDPRANSSSPYQFNGTASDEGTGLKKVEYTFTNPASTSPAPVWTAITGTTNWYGSIGIPSGEGAKTIWFRALDTAGNYSEVYEQQFNFDTAAPTLTAVGKNSADHELSGYTNASYKLAITASDGWGLAPTNPITVTQTNSAINSGNPVNVTVPSGSGTWTITGLPVNASGVSQTTPASGTYVYTITAKDKAGKETTETVTVTVDTTKPNVNEITSPLGGTEAKVGKKAIVGESFMFRGTAKDTADGSGVEKIQYAFTTTETLPADWTDQFASDGDWTFSKDLAEGTSTDTTKLKEGRWYLWVRVWDRAGNISDAVNRMFDVDLDNPTLEIDIPADTGVTTYVGADADASHPAMTISGTATDSNGLQASTATTSAVSVKIGDTTKYATVTGSNWTIGLKSSDFANNTLLNATVTVTDSAGKTTSAIVPFYFDTNGPNVTITKPLNGSNTAEDSYTIEGSITDDGIGPDILYYTLDGTDPDATSTSTPKITIDSGVTSWTKSVNITGDEGQKTLKVRAKDKLGNISAVKSVTFYYDLSDPTLTETAIGVNGASKNAEFSLAGTASDTNGLSSARPITIANSKNSTTWTVIPDNDGNWTKTFKVGSANSSDAAYIADGTVLFTITAEDVAGKQTKLTRSVTVDTTPPVVGDGSFASSLVKLDESPYNLLTVPVTDPNGSGVKIAYYQIAATKPTFTVAATGWTAMTQGTGGWQANVNFPAATLDGTATVWVAAIDMSDNITAASSIKSVTTTIDRMKPSISVSGPTASYATASSGSDAVYTVTVTDSGDVKAPTIVVKDPDGLSVNVQGYTITGTDNKSKTVTLKFRSGSTYFTKSGKYKIVVDVDDINDRSADQVEYEILRDVTPPAITLTNHNSAEEYTQSKNITVTGNVVETNLSTVTATLTKNNVDGTAENVSMNGTTDTKTFEWKIYDQDDGEYIVTITATDLAGNSASKATKKITIDTTAPTSTLTKTGTLYTSTGTTVSSVAADGSYYAKAGFTLGGTITETNFKEATLAIKKNNVAQTPVSITSAGAWSYTQTVNASTHANDGDYVYTLTVKDLANNSFTMTVSVKVDTTAPVLAVTEPIDGYITSHVSEVIKGTAIDNGSGLSKIYYSLENENDAGYDEDAEPTNEVDGSDISGSNWQTTGYFGSSSSAAVEGSYVLKVMAVDVLGNKTEVLKRNYKCDINDPDMTEVEVGDGGLITNSTFSLKGKAWDTNGIAEITVMGQGKTWSSEDGDTFFTFNKALGNGKANAAAVTSNNWQLDFLIGNNATNMTKDNWLKDSTVSFVITIKDVAGKTKSINRTVTIDTTNPSVTIETGDGFTDDLVCQDVSPYNRLTIHASDPDQKDGNGDVIGTGTTGLDGVFYKIADTAPAFTDATESTWTTMAQGANGTWTANVDFSNVDEGTQTVWVAAKDRAGNRIVCSNEVQTTIDEKKPVLEVINGATFTAGAADVAIKIRVKDTNPVAPTVTVTKPDGSALGTAITISDDPVGFSTVPGSEYTEWNATIPFSSSASYFKSNGAYVNGVYTLTINGTDENARAATAITHGIELDTVNPVVAFSTTSAAASSQKTQNITVTGTVIEKNLTKVEAWYVKSGASGDPVVEDITDSLGQAVNNVRNFSWKQYELDEGDYTVYIKATDKAGLTHQLAAGVITIDTTAPDSTILQNAAGQQYTDEGTAVSGTTLTWGTTYYAKDTFTLKGVIDENQLKSAKLTVKKDNGTPSEKNIYSTDASGATVAPTSGASWTAASKIWTFAQNKSAGEGKYVFTLALEDKAGNTTTKTITVYLDLTNPTVTAEMTQSATTPGYTSQSTFTVTGSATDVNLTTVTATLYKGTTAQGDPVDITATLAQNGSFSWKKTVAADGTDDGTYSVKITGTDRVGHVTNVTSETIVVDTTAPTSTLTKTGTLYGSDYQTVTSIAADGSYYAKAGFTLSGTITEANFKEASLSIKKNNVAQTPKTISAAGAWSYVQSVNTTTHADDGTYIYTLTVLDQAGNKLEKTITVMVDTTAPTPTITVPGTDQAFPSSPAAISGTASDGGSGVKKVYYTTDGTNPTTSSTAVVPNGSAWSSSLTFTAQGAFNLKVIAEDNLGNVSSAVSVPFSYDYDIPDLVETIVGEDGLTTNANFAFGGKAWDSNRLEQIIISATIGGESKSWSSLDWTGTKATPTSNFLDIDDGVASAASDLSANNWHFNFKVGEGNASDAAYIPDGTTVFTITVKDVAHKSFSYVRTVTVDTKKPTITKNLGDGFTSALVCVDVSPYSTLKIHTSDTGTGATGVDSAYYQVAATKPDFDDDTDEASWTPMIRGANGLWFAEVDFSDSTTYPDGDYKAWFAAKDRAGNRIVFAGDPTDSEDDGSVLTTVDLHKPVISIAGATEAKNQNVTLTITVADTNPTTPTVQVKKGSTTMATPTASAVTGEATKWTVVVPFSNATFTDGEYQVLVDADDVNSRSADQATHVIKKDTEAPTVNNITSPEAGKTGTDALFGTSYMFRGTAMDRDDGGFCVGLAKISYAFQEAGETGDPVYTDLTMDDGNWSITKELKTGNPTTDNTLQAGQDYLYEGSWTLYVKAIDKAGNESTAATRTFDIDMNAPVLTVTTPADISETFFTKAASLIVKGTATDTNGLQAATASPATTAVKVEIGTSTEYATVNGSNWQITLDRSSYTANAMLPAKVTLTDIAGKTAQVTVPIFFDNKAPDVEITQPVDDEIIVNNTYTITGTASDFGSGVDEATATFTLKRGNTLIKEDVLNFEGASWSFENIALGNDQGTLKLTVKIKDKLGQQTEKTRTFYYDKDLPVIDETNIGVGGLTTNAPFTFSGTASDSNALYDNGSGTGKGAITFSATKNNAAVTLASPTDDVTSGAWTKTFTPGTGSDQLADGTYTFSIKVKDAANRETTIQRTIIIDTGAPTIAKVTGKSSFITDTATGGWYKNGSLALGAVVTDNTGGSGIASVEYAVSTSASTTWTTYADSNWKTMSKSGNTFTASAQVDDGTNYICIRAKDQAGNTTYTTQEMAKVDTASASLIGTYEDAACTEEVLTKVSNAGATVTVYIKTSDSGSGVATVKAKIGDKFTTTDNVLTATAVTGETDLYKLDITAAQLATGRGSADTQKTVWVKITDAAGNESNAESLFTLDYDTTKPVITFTGPGADDVVNKTINITGRTTDNKVLESISLYYLYGTATTGVTDDNLATKVTGATQIGQTKEGDAANSWTYDFDTTTVLNRAKTSAAENTTLILIAKATDEAGNVQYKKHTVSVDQETDCPEIKITNIAFTIKSATDNGGTPVYMSSSDPAWLINTGLIYGTITDDDGIVRLEMSTDNGTTWTNVPAPNGNFTATLTSDDAYTVLFRATDIYSNPTNIAYDNPNYGSVCFTTADSNAIKNIKIKGSDDAYSTDGKLYVTVDTQKPDILDTRYSLKTVAASAAADWSTTLLSSADGVFGGTVNTNLGIKQYAYDTNGVAKVEIAIDGGTPVAATQVTADTVSDSGKTFTAWTCDIGSSVLTALATSNNHTLKITVTDNAGMVKETTSALKIDNTAPTVSVTSHAAGAHVKGNVTVAGTTSDAPNYVPAATMLYKVTASETLAANEDWTVYTTASETYGAHNVKGNLGSWRIYFDGGVTLEDEYTHDRALKDVLLMLPEYNYLEKATTGDHIGAVVYKTAHDGHAAGELYTEMTLLYLHFKTTDAAGNTVSQDVQAFELDPQGDIPTVTVTYPNITAYGWKNGTASVVTKTKAPNVGDSVYESIDKLTTATGTISAVNRTAKTITVGSTTYSSYGGETVQGGIVRIQGTADDENAIAGIYMQIDPTYDASEGFHWDATGNEAGIMPKAGKKLSDYYNSANGNAIVDIGTTGMKGIKVGDSIAWSATINRFSEFNAPTAAAGQPVVKNRVGIRLYALDVDGHVSPLNAAEDLIIIIDADTPTIGNNEELYLKQYSNNAAGTGTVIASQKYEDDMWLNGIWWLEGSVEDSNGIQQLTAKKYNAAADEYQDIASSDWSKTEVEASTDWDGTYGYRIKVKVGSATANEFGTLKYELYAMDNDTGTPKTVTKYLTINYDNKAPELIQRGADGYNINPKVTQSNGFYYLSSAVKEDTSTEASQSGFERLALYFVRPTVGGTTGAVFDTYNLKNTTGNRLALNASNIVFEDGLYWKQLNVERSENNLSTLTLGEADPNVHTGGLVKIGGAIYLITSASGTNVTIKGSPEYTSSDEDVLFAIAAVVDHTVSEGTGSTLVNGYYTDIVNTDGDYIVESVTKSGTKWIWDASICSRNIPDGDIEIHYVAFDKAGNYSHGVVGCTGTTYTGAGTADYYDYQADNKAMVSNNAPRLAGIAYGADINGNFTVDTGEMTEEWFAMTETDGKKSYTKNQLVTSYLLGSKVGTTYSGAVLNVKGPVKLVPEIVGGNGALYYDWSVTQTGSGSAYYSVAKKSLATAGDDYSEGRDVDGEGNLDLNGEFASNAVINLSLADLFAKQGGVELEDANNQLFTFRIWDSTDGRTAGSTSQFATIEMVMNVALKDETAPVVKIDPLSSSSVYTVSSTKKGHIDLSADLPSATFKDTNTDKELDTDDKVSGSIVITGSVSDETLLKGIYMKLVGNGASQFAFTGNLGTSGSYYKVANYNNGWTTSGNYADEGWVFTIDTNTLTKDGHEVTWTLVLNTEKLTTKVMNDLQLSVMAEDLGKPQYDTSGNLKMNGAQPDLLPNQSNPGTQKTAAATKTGFNQFDVVPYITKVSTALDNVYSSNTSVFNRSATGYYPVRRGETITISGWNLKTGTTAPTITVNGTSMTVSNTSENSAQVTISNTATSGDLQVAVTYGTGGNAKTVKSLNNLHDASKNLEPNGINNDVLTDIRKLYVWKFTNVVTDNTVRYPTFAVGKDTNQTVGFAYDSGAQRFKMYLDSNLGTNKDFVPDYSFTQFYATGVAVDTSGRIYGVSQNGDSGGSGAQAYSANNTTYANSYFYAWNTQTYPGQSRYNSNNDWRTSDGFNYSAYSTGRKKVAIESAYNGTKFNGERVQSPSIVTYIANNTNAAYVAYYDSSDEKIVFRYGTVSGTANTNNSSLSFTGGLGNHGTGSTSASNGQTVTSTTAGEYVSVGVVPTGVTGAGTAVVAWTDGQKLYYSYNTEPATVNNATWATNTVCLDSDFAGWYVDMDVDKGGGVHIAYYSSSSCDLRYIYLPAYNQAANAQKVVVDSYLSVGSNISVSATETTVTANGVTRYVPYITYYMSAYTKTSYSTRVAWPVKLDSTGKFANGADNDKATGYWEMMTVPTSSIPLDYSIGVGVKKNDNNTNSVIMGYGTKDGLQCAQLQ